MTETTIFETFTQIGGVLGTGASLAWFADSDTEVNNIFHFADFSVSVAYQEADGTWADVDGATEIFERNARYEPGYTQVVYLRVENSGDRAFRFDTAVTVTGYTVATNVFGQSFSLQDYLRFGFVTAATEADVKARVATRSAAQAIATTPLNRYHEADQPDEELTVDGVRYVALVVYMPEDVGNIANYDGGLVPTVDLGIIVTADQIV